MLLYKLWIGFCQQNYHILPEVFVILVQSQQRVIGAIYFIVGDPVFFLLVNIILTHVLQ